MASPVMIASGFSRPMKAILVRAFGPPEVMRLEDIPEPTLAPSQVPVRVRAAGVNPVDAYVRSGTYARKPSLPYVPGSDGAGVIERVGSQVTAFAPGDRVYLGPDGVAVSGAGTYAECAACDAGKIGRAHV